MVNAFNAKTIDYIKDDYLELAANVQTCPPLLVACEKITMLSFFKENGTLQKYNVVFVSGRGSPTYNTLQFIKFLQKVCPNMETAYVSDPNPSGI